jgi:hypothetical protein
MRTLPKRRRRRNPIAKAVRRLKPRIVRPKKGAGSYRRLPTKEAPPDTAD